jgi:hypothetical protein
MCLVPFVLNPHHETYVSVIWLQACNKAIILYPSSAQMIASLSVMKQSSALFRRNKQNADWEFWEFPGAVTDKPPPVYYAYRKYSTYENARCI